MSINYEIDFEESLLLGGGSHIIDNHEEMQMCHEFVLRSTEGTKLEKVGLLSGKLVNKDKLFGPASEINKTVIYPCSRNRCQVMSSSTL